MKEESAPTPEQKAHKSLPIISVFKRYWWLVLVFAVFVAAALNNWLFLYLRQLVYLPMLVTGCALSALWIRNLIFRGSIDSDVDSGLFTESWYSALSSRDRVILTIVVFLVLFLGSAWIAAALI